MPFLFLIKLLINLWTSFYALYMFHFYIASLLDRKFRNSRVHHRIVTRCAKYAHMQFIVFRIAVAYWIILIFVYMRIASVYCLLQYLLPTSTRIKFISASRYSEILFLSVVKFYVPPSRICVRSLCRLTFINYCLRRGRMRSHKSNRALFVSLSAMYARKMLYVRLYILSALYAIIRYIPSCVQFYLDISKKF